MKFCPNNPFCSLLYSHTGEPCQKKREFHVWCIFFASREEAIARKKIGTNSAETLKVTQKRSDPRRMYYSTYIRKKLKEEILLSSRKDTLYFAFHIVLRKSNLLHLVVHVERAVKKRCFLLLFYNAMYYLSMDASKSSSFRHSSTIHSSRWDNDTCLHRGIRRALSVCHSRLLSCGRERRGAEGKRCGPRNNQLTE